MVDERVVPTCECPLEDKRSAPCGRLASHVLLWPARRNHRDTIYQYRCRTHARLGVPSHRAQSIPLADVRGGPRNWCEWTCTPEQARPRGPLSRPRRPEAVLIGKRIRAIREQLGLKMYELAQRAGKGEGHLGRWERGEMLPTEEALRDLADVAGVSVEVFKL